MSARVLIDCDGVLSDFVGTFLDYVQSQHGLTYRREAIDQWDCFEACGLAPAEWQRFADAVGPLNLCGRMLDMPGSTGFYATVEGLFGPDNVRVATTPMCPAWLGQRAEWLEARGIPFKRHIHLHEKEHLVGAFDVLVDDRVENCIRFAQAGGHAFCIAAPYNAHLSDTERVARGTHAECVMWLARSFTDLL